MFVCYIISAKVDKKYVFWIIITAYVLYIYVEHKKAVHYCAIWDDF